MDKPSKWEKGPIGGQGYKPFDLSRHVAKVAEEQREKNVAPSSSDTPANKGGLTILSNDSGYWSEEEYSHKKVPNGELHGSASQALTESISSDDGKVYKNLGYEVPKGREGMEEQTVREYLEDKKIKISAISKRDKWILDRKLGEFQHFWEDKPLEFEKLGEVRSQNSTGGKGADSRQAFEYSGRFGEAELGRGEVQKRESWKVPKFIGDKRVVNVSGEGNDCLLRSLGTAAGVKDLEKFVNKGRKYLVDKRLAQQGKMLDLGTSQGVELVEHFRDENELSSERGIRLHTFSPEGKLRYIDVIPGIEGQHPYEVFLMNGHFQALVDTGKPSHEHEQAPIRVNEMSKVDSPAKQKLTKLLREKSRKITKEDDRGSITDFKKYELSKTRLLDLMTKLAPTGYEEKYEQEIKKYCETFKLGEKHLEIIINVIEPNKDEVCRWLFEDRNNREAFINQLPKPDSMPQRVFTTHETDALAKHQEKRFSDLITNMAPDSYETAYREAAKIFSERFKANGKDISKFTTLVEANKDTVSRWLSENKGNLEKVIAQLAEQKPMEQELISPYADAKTQLDLERPSYGTAAGEA